MPSHPDAIGDGDGNGRRKEYSDDGSWMIRPTERRPMKTNAARLLDSLGIAYEIREYEVDPDDLSAQSVARKVGMPPEQVFKTLVARGDRTGVCFAVVPGDSELDLKALAQLTGDRKVDTVPLKDVQPLTGYIRGGVTVLGAKKAYPVFVDETIELFDIISVSAGTQGAQLILSPADYLRAVGGKTGAMAKAK
jgi:Cys-tRNA(Pro)/Cys-tRNA(Cys) deacylase